MFPDHSIHSWVTLIGERGVKTDYDNPLTTGRRGHTSSIALNYQTGRKRMIAMTGT